MSFKVYIYYCALCGGWAAFLAWGVAAVIGLTPASQDLSAAAISKAMGIGAVLGFFVAGAVGFVDAVLNSVGMMRLVRVFISGALGLAGGALGGLIGGFAVSMSGNIILMVPGWLLVGTLIGASIGVFDLVRAATTGGDLKSPLNKFLNGIYGGLLGGTVGGFLFTGIFSLEQLRDLFENARLTAGLVLLGLCIGLLIGVAQVVLKQAWIRVEAGFRPGRELLLTKDETTIGRAEGCDLGLFGDNQIQKIHAKIVLKDNRYLLTHAADDGETLLNGSPISKPTPLRAGDQISLGRSVLSFGEKEKRR